MAATTFALVFPAELPDKTALASLMLGSRYRPIYVFTGVAAAFAVHVLLALVAGSLLALLPHRVLSIIVAVLFGLGAVVLIRGRKDADEAAKEDKETPPTFLRVAVDQLPGDLRRRVRRPDPDPDREPGRQVPRPARGRPRVAGWRCVAVAALAVAGGRGLLRLIPARTITLIGAAAMAVLAVINLINAIRG